MKQIKYSIGLITMVLCLIAFLVHGQDKPEKAPSKLILLITN
jgi:hypothetical protein